MTGSLKRGGTVANVTLYEMELVVFFSFEREQKMISIYGKR
ncbi:hypothetical protein ACQSD2_03805 [Streptococcus infantarius]|jgi:hypothetical protein|nr:hypothetical protein [Streptococcus infantarius]AEZ61911.1 hypothetical protein Sinf_0559 [Streptococcus infantarius subsp. infantarius CJ18]